MIRSLLGIFLACNLLAQEGLTNGQNHSGAISTPGQTQTWSFAAGAGDSISLSVGEVTDTSGGLFWPWIRLRAPNGTELSSTSGSLAAQINTTATQSGTYTVVVGSVTSSSNFNGTGTYLLTLAKTPGEFVVPGGDQGGPLTNGQNHPGEIHLGDLDQWSFTASAGDAISLSIGEVSETSTSFWPWIRLRAPNGTQLTSTSGSLVAQISTTAAQSGTYTVVVGTITSSSNINGIGTYLLTLAKTPGEFVVPGGDQGGPLTNGQNHPGEIHLGDLDQWSFTASAGDAISLSIGEVSETSTSFWPWIRLRAPNGTQLTSTSGSLVL